MMPKKVFISIFAVIVLIIMGSITILSLSNSNSTQNIKRANDITATETSSPSLTPTLEITNRQDNTTTSTIVPTSNKIGTLDKWIYYPVDKVTALPDTFVPQNLVSLSANGVKAVSGSLQMRNEVISDLKSLFSDAQKAGINLQITSAYRSYSYQNTLFNSYVQDDINKGMTKEAATADANRSSAMPGHSEHQLGTTCDVISTSDSTLDFTSTNTRVWDWLDKNLVNHGFVLSYPEGKESKTGYVYEPWHIRWVGVNLAKEISNTDYLNTQSTNTSTSYLKNLWEKIK